MFVDLQYVICIAWKVSLNVCDMHSINIDSEGKLYAVSLSSID